jgi:hypothetical protein
MDLGEIQIKIREIQIKKKFLFGVSTQKLENPGNPNKNYEIREIQIKNREIQIINIKSGKSK